MNVAIRLYHRDDTTSLFAIFVEAVRVGAAQHYTPAQRQAWAPQDHMPEGWPERLARTETWVAEVDGELAGFMAWDAQGYIDLAFVRPRWMGRGVAQALYECILERARGRDLSRLTTHASHLARVFFARQGWQVDYPEKKRRNGQVLERFAMFLDLGDTQ